MTETQPEGSETTRDAMEEDLIEESAFGLEETDQYERVIIYKRQQTKRTGKQIKRNKKAKKFSWSTAKVEVLLIFENNF